MEVCELSRSCLKCRFTRCVYDKPRGKRQQLKNRRDRKIARFFHRGKDTKELARRFGVSRRTVQRAVKGVGRNNQITRNKRQTMTNPQIKITKRLELEY